MRREENTEGIHWLYGYDLSVSATWILHEGKRCLVLYHQALPRRFPSLRGDSSIKAVHAGYLPDQGYAPAIYT